MQREATILRNDALARGTWLLELHVEDIPAVIEPGQFVMLKLPGNDPLLGRAFALYDVVAVDRLQIVYFTVGKMTNALADVTVGRKLSLWGPLGQPFPRYEESEQLDIVAGGIGVTPFRAMCKQLLGQQIYGKYSRPKPMRKIRFFYGVRSASQSIQQWMDVPGVEWLLASDDGTLGHAGRITEIIDLAPCPILACGPEPMLHAVSRVARRQERTCHVSLETPMACGIGACFSCVVAVEQANGQPDYKRVCVDGPTFPADKLCDFHSN